MIIAVDLDGVIAKYNGFQGKRKFGDPIDGVGDALRILKHEGHKILINTTRLEIDDVSKYLDKNKIPYDFINCSPDNDKLMLHPAKQAADVYIDDRAIQFNGSWGPKLITEILEFKPWWRRE